MQFWVRSAVTGTHICQLQDQDNTRHISDAYTISAADTWEYKTVTFAGDTTGAFNKDVNRSLIVRWWMGSGSDHSSGTLQTTWAAEVQANDAVGQVNIAGTTSNIFALAGVQIEEGSTQTDFEHRPFSVELALCQRYYIRYGATTGSYATGMCVTATRTDVAVHLPVPLRAAPTVTENNSRVLNGASTFDVTAIASVILHGNIVRMQLTNASGPGIGDAGLFENDGAAGHLDFAAEL